MVGNRSTVWARGMAGLAAMSPAYFGLVMATGIISLAAHMLGHARLATALLVLNTLQYLLLWALYVLRAVKYPRNFFGDLVAHSKGPAYFTLVAGTGVLASQFMVMRDSVLLGRVLWVLLVLLWFLCTYVVFTALTVKHNKPSLEHGINGGWLLAVVATQAVSVCSTLLAARGGSFRMELNFIALSTWLYGGMLYIWMMSLIFYRYTFFRLRPGDLAPPYWINMGAMAISTLAGALLITQAPSTPFLESLQPFLKGVTVFYWATGTWWIPMLLMLGAWRHGIRHYPLRYDPLYWGAVFPLGMYAACTWQLRTAMDLDFLGGLVHFFFWAAIVAWLLAFSGMLHRLLKILRPRSVPATG